MSLSSGIVSAGVFSESAAEINESSGGMVSDFTGSGSAGGLTGRSWPNATTETRRKINDMTKGTPTRAEMKLSPLSFTKKFTILRKGIANPLNIVKAVRNIGISVLFLAITLLNSSSTTIDSDFKLDVVVIDAGHGGKDTGTIGKKAKEKDVALRIALLLGGYIEKNLPGVKVIYTRKDDRFLELEERAAIANKARADLFICIHANANKNSKAHGTETYVMGLHKDEGNLEVAMRENSVILQEDNHEERYEGFDPKSTESYILMSISQSAYLEGSLSFAGKVESQFKGRAGRVSRGVKQAGFWVLWRTTMPSVLIETGFLSNGDEEQFLASENGQELIASGIYRAFKEYKAEVEAIN